MVGAGDADGLGDPAPDALGDPPAAAPGDSLAAPDPAAAGLLVLLEETHPTTTIAAKASGGRMRHPARSGSARLVFHVRHRPLPGNLERRDDVADGPRI